MVLKDSSNGRAAGMRQGSLFEPAAAGTDRETVELLLERPGVRIERIVSTGQTTPPGQWYDQSGDEWVALLAGRATLRLAGRRPRRAGAGRLAADPRARPPPRRGDERRSALRLAGRARGPRAMTAPREAVFHVHKISKVYRMGDVEVHALRGVDVDLFAGEFVVLLGPSGSGKSTLLNILGGLDVPTSGEVLYRDHVLTTAGDAELTRFRREHVGYVFQFYNLIPSLTALENVALVTEIATASIDPAEALRLVDLGDRLNHFPAQLSGGEQQRVAIARAVAKRPDVLLCDEPTGALDYPTGKLVLEVLERVNREMGTLTVVITHNAAIAGMAERVIRISSGEIVEVTANEPPASRRRNSPGNGGGVTRRGGLHRRSEASTMEVRSGRTPKICT